MKIYLYILLIFIFIFNISFAANTWSVKNITVSTDHFDTDTINLKLLNCKNVFRVVNVWGENNKGSKEITKHAEKFIIKAKKDGLNTTAMLGALAIYMKPHLKGYSKHFVETVGTRDPLGNLVFKESEQHYHGCLTNPNWQKQFQKLIHILIDTGINGIEIDQPALENWLGECYCPYCMKEFNNYIKNNYSDNDIKNKLHIKNIDTFNYVKYLKATGLAKLSEYDRMNKSYWGHIFRKFQYKQNAVNIKKLIYDVKEYARSKGKKLSVFCNSWGLSAEYIPPLLYTDITDIAGDLRSINIWDPDNDKTGPPFVSWIPIAKMARAINYFMNKPEKPILTFLDTRGYEIAMKQFNNKTDLGKIIIAESLSENSIPVFPYKNRVAPPQKSNFPFKMLLQYSSVLNFNKNIFEDSARSIANCGIFIPYSTLIWQRFSSDLIGLSYLLMDSHIPFRVIFNGDGQILNDSLKLNDIKNFKYIFLANTTSLTKNEKNILVNYLKTGGKIIRTGYTGVLDELGYRIKDITKDKELSFILNNNNCYNYKENVFDYAKSKSKEQLKKFKNMIKNKTNISTIKTNAESFVKINPVKLKNGNIVIHIVNSNYSHSSQSVIVTNNFNVSLETNKKPKNIKLLSWDTNISKKPEYYFENNTLKIKINTVDIYSTIYIEF